MEQITRREALAAGVVGVGLMAKAVQADDNRAEETQPATIYVVGNLIIATFLVRNIPNDGKSFTAVFGQPIVGANGTASVAAFDVRYTTGGGFKVQGVNAAASIKEYFPRDGKVTIK